MDYFPLYSQLKKTWSEYSSQQFSKAVEKLFMESSEPYDFLMACIKIDGEIYYIKTNTMIAKICFEFEQILSWNEKGFTSSPSPELQKEAFHIATKIKNKALLNTFVNCFRFGENADLFYPLLLIELERGKFKEVCSFVVKLDMQSRFTTNQILVPLFIEDAIPSLESFLDASLAHREEFLVFLDRLVGGKISMGSILHDANIRNVKGQKTHKTISKLAMRLSKKYEIDMKICPHLVKRQDLGSIRYLFCRRYNSNELSIDSFLPFLKDIAISSPSVRDDILDSFISYNDTKCAAMFLRTIDHADLILHPLIKEEMKISAGATTISDSMDSMVVNTDSNEFFQLHLPYSSIIMVDSIEKFDDAIFNILLSDVAGIDSEWKPSFQANAKSEVAILQIAIATKVYLFDMISLPQELSDTHWDKLGSVFSDCNVCKLVYAFKGDCLSISSLHPILAKHLKNKSNILDFDVKKRILIDHHPELFSFPSSSERGLSELIHLSFGKPLDKRQQCSYWLSRPLSREQIIYAAIDAHCLLDLHNFLQSRCNDLKLGDWRLFKTMYTVPLMEKMGKTSVQEYIPTRKVSISPCFASGFKVVCDTMVQGLGKLLRHCNVDTVILESHQSHEECAKYWEKDGRTVLTRGKYVYDLLRAHVPSAYLYVIQNEDPKLQLKEIIHAYQVIIKYDDVFARCGECNSIKFLYVEPKIFRKLLFTGISGPDPGWVAVDGGKLNIYDKVTDLNATITYEIVPIAVLDTVEVIYICKLCGKCYWDGSHYDRILDSTLKDVIQEDDTPCPSVPSPNVP